MRTTRGVLAASALTLALALCGCGGGTSSDDTGAEPKAAPSESIDCLSQTIGQEKWMEHCADQAEPEAEEEQATDLKFGQTFAFDDGVKVTVTQVEKITKFGEFDSTPEKGETGFRVHITFDNSSSKPLDLDEMSLLVEGATNGGEAAVTTFEVGAKEITGRVAPGVTATKNSDWVLADEYGKQVLVTVQRVSEDVDLFDQAPEWTGPIR